MFPWVILANIETIFYQSASGEGYQPLVGLQDIKTIKQLSQESVRDILRASTRDSELKIVSMGQLNDMSGTNDAFNSSICSLEVREQFVPGQVL